MILILLYDPHVVPDFRSVRKLRTDTEQIFFPLIQKILDRKLRRNIFT